MSYAIAMLVCVMLSALIALRLVPMVVRMCKKSKIIYLFSIVAYQHSKPQDALEHARFSIGLLCSIPRLLAIVRKIEKIADNEQKL